MQVRGSEALTKKTQRVVGRVPNSGAAPFNNLVGKKINLQPTISEHLETKDNNTSSFRPKKKIWGHHLSAWNNFDANDEETRGFSPLGGGKHAAGLPDNTKKNQVQKESRESGEVAQVCRT